MPIEYPLENKSPNFIGAWYLDDIGICDQLVELWKNSETKNEGTMYDLQGQAKVDYDFKESTDLSLHLRDQNPILQKYVEELQTVVEKYKQRFPCCDMYASWGIIDSINVQHYPPGGGFKAWHTERGFSNNEFVSSRHLVFMTYLNDCSDGGGTEFMHQEITTPCKKGLTVIWPADWTHTHRGEISPSQDKWIITGWYNYLS